VIRRHRGDEATPAALDPPTTDRRLGRRGLLAGGLAAVGGGVLAAATSGTAAGGTAATADPVPVVGLPGAVSLTLRGADWRHTAPAPAVGFGAPAAAPASLSTVGRFVDASDVTIGDFRATALGTGADAPQLHILTLHDGHLLAMGSGPLDEAHYAIVGGTGAYLGATGGYVARQSPHGAGGSGTATFSVTLLLAEQRVTTALGAAPSSTVVRS
jgi:hypothetical protein